MPSCSLHHPAHHARSPPRGDNSPSPHCLVAAFPALPCATGLSTTEGFIGAPTRPSLLSVRGNWPQKRPAPQ